ncbi:MAG: hypothetical protein HY343_04865 [Lentisphaerae bacterium]|nr:hypothetical protein [Lentisphaerota bacterium]
MKSKSIRIHVIAWLTAGLCFGLWMTTEFFPALLGCLAAIVVAFVSGFVALPVALKGLFQSRATPWGVRVQYGVVAAMSAIVLGMPLVIGGMWLHYQHQTQQVRESLARQITDYAVSFPTTQSNVVTRCSDGSWLGCVRFQDGDWAGVAHHSRHTKQSLISVGDVTVVLTSDGTFYDSYMHYCKDVQFEFEISRETYGNRTDFLARHFYRPLMMLDKDFKPSGAPINPN